MDIFYISESCVTLNSLSDAHAPDSLRSPFEQATQRRFMWIDVTHDEVAQDQEKWRDEIERLTGIRIYDLHLKDVLNLTHPSYFDSTHDYELVVFQKLAFNRESSEAQSAEKSLKSVNEAKKIPAALHQLQTQPVSFLLLGTALVTVRAQQSRTIESTRHRLLQYRHKTEGISHASRLPVSPEDLMLRLLNAMVDQYLDLRQPLTQQLDRWQHALLDPRRPFNNWVALLDSRIELRRLDHLCEEQYDALQELRDHFVDSYDSLHDTEGRAKDLLLVRTNDVMEHINRVLNHARRLEASLESSVQIHFAAMAHRTSEIMRLLTVITALFMPLTLLTGVFGMNFVSMPLISHAYGFWVAIGIMALIVLFLVLIFRSQNYFDRRTKGRLD